MPKQRYLILESHSLKHLRDSVNSLMADGYMILGNSPEPSIYQLGGSQLYIQAMQYAQYFQEPGSYQK